MAVYMAVERQAVGTGVMRMTDMGVGLIHRCLLYYNITTRVYWNNLACRRSEPSRGVRRRRIASAVTERSQRTDDEKKKAATGGAAALEKLLVCRGSGFREQFLDVFPVHEVVEEG